MNEPADRSVIAARVTALEQRVEELETWARREADRCGTCGCFTHSCAADCDCCPEHALAWEAS